MKTNRYFIDIFDKAADEYVAQYMDVRAYAQPLLKLLDQIPKAAKVLDLACGPGNVAHFCLGINNDLQWWGIDGSQTMINYAQRKNPSGHFFRKDCRTQMIEANEYNAIICSFLLPYLNENEIATLFNKMANGLRSHETLYLASTLERADISKNLDNRQTQTHYYSEEKISAWIKRNHLSILDTYYITNPVNQDKELIILAKKSPA